MKRWKLVWETGTNRYSELHYSADSVAACITRWQGAHPTKDIRLIVGIQEVGYPFDLTPVDSRDADGHFCGQDVKTGTFVPAPEGKVGYCGPNCEHCLSAPVYSIEDGVWVCAADNDAMAGG